MHNGICWNIWESSYSSSSKSETKYVKCTDIQKSQIGLNRFCALIFLVLTDSTEEHEVIMASKYPYHTEDPDAVQTSQMFRGTVRFYESPPAFMHRKWHKTTWKNCNFLIYTMNRYVNQLV